MDYKVIVEKINKNAIIPTKNYETDSGWDLYSCDEYFLDVGKRCLVDIGIKIKLPVGYDAEIRSRSGLALKNGVFVLNSPGTIDFSYHGSIKVILYNTGDNFFAIRKGDRIAQMVIRKVYNGIFEEGVIDTISDRNDKGFGSSGV